MSDPSKRDSVLIPGPSHLRDVVSLNAVIRCVEMGRGETLEFPVPGTR